METTQEQITKSDFEKLLFEVSGIGRRFDEIDRRFIELDKKLDRFISDVDRRFTEMDRRFERLEKQWDKLDSRLWTSFFIIMISIIGLYGTIIFGLFFRQPHS